MLHVCLCVRVLCACEYVGASMNACVCACVCAVLCVSTSWHVCPCARMCVNLGVYV